jgi:hypothetical protein
VEALWDRFNFRCHAAILHRIRGIVTPATDLGTLLSLTTYQEG